MKMKMKAVTLPSVSELRKRGRASLKNRWGSAILALIVLAVFALSYVPLGLGQIIYEEYQYAESQNDVEDSIEEGESEEPVEYAPMTVLEGINWVWTLAILICLLVSVLSLAATPLIALIGGIVRVWYADVTLSRFRNKLRSKRSFGQKIKLYFKTVLFTLLYQAGTSMLLFMMLPIAGFGGAITSFNEDKPILVIAVCIIVFLIHLAILALVWILNLDWKFLFYALADDQKIIVVMTRKEQRQVRNKNYFGCMWKLFCLRMSFLPGILFSILTLGLGFLVVIPRLHAAEAALYESIAHPQKKGLLAKFFS